MKIEQIGEGNIRRYIIELQTRGKYGGNAENNACKSLLSKIAVILIIKDALLSFQRAGHFAFYGSSSFQYWVFSGLSLTG